MLANFPDTRPRRCGQLPEGEAAGAAGVHASRVGRVI